MNIEQLRKAQQINDSVKKLNQQLEIWQKSIGFYNHAETVPLRTAPKQDIAISCYVDITAQHFFEFAKDYFIKYYTKKIAELEKEFNEL